MPDIKDMEGPVKFKKGVELYFDPKKDMFYDPKKKKYVSEKDILKLEDFDFDELETIEEGVYDPSIFKAIFMAGGPGSGKSYVSNKVTAGLGMKVVNSYDIFEIFLKKAGMTTTAKDIFSDKGQEIRGNAKSVTSKRMKLYLEGRLGLLIDGTGKDYSNIKKKADRLRDLGYDTYMVFVNTSLEIAQERNAARSRKLDPKEVEKMWRAVQENIGKFQKYFGARNMIIVDNNAADEKYLTDVYRQVKKLIKKPAQNRLARDWISKALDDKVRNEEVELFEKSEEYQKFFQSALKKFGIDSPAELDDKKKKEFFDYVDANWEGENEEDEEETIEELNIGMSFAGNGLSVYDRDRESSGDYVKIAHVQGKPNQKVKDGDDITLNIYDKKKSNHKAIIAKVEKSFPKSKIKVDDRSKMKMTQEELSLEEAIEEAKEWKVGAPVFIVISYHTNGKHSTTVLRTKEKAMKFAKDEEYHEDDVKGTAVLDMKVGKFIDKETGKYIKEDVELSEKIHPALRKLETALNKFHKGSELDDLVPEYGAKIVDGKKVYHIEYKKGKKEGEEFAKSLQKALKASSFSVMPYRGDDSMVSIEIKEETVSPKMAAYLNFLNKNLEEGKKDYEIYHNTFSSAIDEVKKFAKKNGYELDDDDLFHTVGTGPKKPSTGKTNKYHLTLMKNGKENKKKLHFQVYGMKTQYELNMYIS